MKKEKIAVIGAGPMGLATAYQLAKDGYDPVLFEADDRVGGMTASFDFSGTFIERYYHFHCISDHDFFELLEELDLSNQLVWRETKMGYWFDNKLQPWGNPLALLKFKGLSLTAKFRYGLHAFLCTKRDNWLPLDDFEATSWIKKWVGSEAYEVLWRRLFEYKFYNHSDQLSAAWIWSRIRRIGRSRYNIFKEKLGYLEGGSNTLLSALSEKITELGGEIRLSTPVHEVMVENDKVTAIKTANGVEHFDKVISTVPLPFVSRMIPALPKQVAEKFDSVKNVAVVCVIAKLKQQLTENFWLNTNDPDMDIPGIVEYSNLRPLDDHIVYVPFYMPKEHKTYQDSDEMFLEKVKSYFLKINSSLNDSDIIEIKANRYAYAQPVCPPGFSSHLPSAYFGIEGLWVADTSYYYPEDRGISESIGFGRNLAKEASK
ncbi:NAD(P)/FAD-dependent oxidoreductase [Vibrio cholerae]|uniref:NAD(P)/FAD-dependent oxidoreductase n=1 Tax=Vibrio cholerae TaxID=666 RepID=UPI001C302C8E